MELTLKFDGENSLIRAGIGGKFVISEARNTFLRILDALVENRAKKVLVDAYTVSGEPEVIERFIYSKFAAKSVADLNKRGVFYNPQFAYVLQEPVLDKHRFGETVARNRGMRVTVFDNMPAAERWLEITSFPSTEDLHKLKIIPHINEHFRDTKDNK